MAKVLIVTFPNGDRYSVPAEVIARNRATHYAEKDPETTYQEEFDYTMGDDFELKDWAGNKMHWSDMASQATKMPRPQEELDLDKSYWSAELSVSDIQPEANESLTLHANEEDKTP